MENMKEMGYVSTKCHFLFTLVLCDIPPEVNNILKALGHAPGQGLEVSWADLPPGLRDGFLKARHRIGLHSRQLFLDVCPGVLNRVKVR